MKGKLIFLVFGLITAQCLFPTWLLGQTATDSLKLLIQTEVSKEVAEQLKWPYQLGLMSISGLTLYVVYMYFYGVRKKAEAALDEKIAEIIETRLADKLGVKLELVRAYFMRLEQEQAVLEARILIVSNSGDKDKALIDLLRKQGFVEKNIQSRSLSAVQKQLDPNTHELMLFDDRDGQLAESDVTSLIDQYPRAFSYVCLTSKNWSTANYQTYTQQYQLKLLKDPNYLVETIKKALL